MAQDDVPEHQLTSVFTVAADSAALVEFYRSIGLHVRFADAHRWTQFAAGPADLAIADTTEGLGMTSGRFVPVLKSADVAASVRHVERCGGQAGPTRDMGAHGVAVLVQDPEGNPIVIQGDRP